MFSILIRHRGSIDRFLRTIPRAHYSEDSIIAWIAYREHDMCHCDTREEAERIAADFSNRLGSEGHRFDVIEQRMISQWFLVNPTNEQEKQPVGSVDQL